MTLNHLEPPLQKGGEVSEFSQFFDATHTTKWLEIDQDNLHMKFSALNVDFNSASPDPLSSRRPVQTGVKNSYP